MKRADAPLTVIVTSYQSPLVLEKCLAALCAQPEVSQIVVADCSAVNPASALQTRFPDVTFLHWDEPQIVPAMRWAALEHVQTDLVGAVEARTIPQPDWARRIVEAHAAHPECPAVGGSVALAEPSSAFGRGLYLCEYGAYTPPLPVGFRYELAGANLSYKHGELVKERDLLTGGKWETLIHLRWKQQGKALWMSEATIVFENTMTPWAAMQQRFFYGRGYAANRFGQRNVPYALIALLLPLLLTWRTAQGKNRRLLSFATLGWLLTLNSAWALGEAFGYATGNAGEPRIF